jgi:hypothetical protein
MPCDGATTFAATASLIESEIHAGADEPANGGAESE